MLWLITLMLLMLPMLPIIVQYLININYPMINIISYIIYLTNVMQLWMDSELMLK